MFIRISIFLLLVFSSVFYPKQASALTFFRNICLYNDHRYYEIDYYQPPFIGYQDIYNYPFTYQLPWNPCFNYCTRCPRPCFEHSSRSYPYEY